MSKNTNKETDTYKYNYFIKHTLVCTNQEEDI